MRGLAGALAFMTIVGRGAKPTPESVMWFPVVGLVLGAATGGVWHGVTEVWTPVVAAGLVVVTDAVLTGALHYDGLADAADGLLPHAAADRRLAIMASPDVGAFALVVVVLVLVLKVAALAAIDPEIWLLVALGIAARSGAGLILCAVPYARTGGIAVHFGGGSRGTVVVMCCGLGAALAVGIVTMGLRGGVAIGVAVLAGTAVAELGRRRIGGYTGDVVGAVIVVVETVGLVAAAG